ncbi:peroxidase 5-like [Ananas comosus]|uniref:Peroxidase n=1 Tax=Ananas comosus TaxID=4615 RepID=A0A6P5FJ42_ANACO|nr:peroxidase 5-like [Ananas comosus]
MAFKRGNNMFLSLALCVLSFTEILSSVSEAQLQVGFYNTTCPSAESIVRDEVTKAVTANAALAAGLLRMHFHDCFVRGCDASVLIDSTTNNTAEKDAPPNKSLRGFEVIDNAKARLEQTCKGIVSCADILAFAARDSIVLTGGYSYKVPAGRKDGRVSVALETLGNLPPPSSDLTQLTQMFANKGFTQDEMITLSGAHTIGYSQCSSFSSRLFSFNSTMSQDPILNSTYASQLKRQCPQGSSNASLSVPIDLTSPNAFDSGYYSNLLANRGLFTSDQMLTSVNTTAVALVRQYANNSALFLSSFATAMVKMGYINVTTGSNGEIRANCRVIN